MSPPLSEPVLYRLYLARQAFENGRRLAADPLPYPRMQSVMALDDAVEWTTLTLLSVLQVRPKRDAALSEYLVPLVAAHPTLGSHAGPAEALRRLRDRVKHDGVIPSAEDARRAAVEVESLLRAAIHAVLGRDLEELSPLALVEADDVRACLIAAQDAVATEKYRDAVTEAARAFAIGRPRWFREYRPGRPQDEAARLFRQMAGGSGFRYEREVRELFASLQEPVLYLRVGLNLDELERFEAITPQVVTFGDGHMEVLHGRSHLPSKDDAAFALDFATRSVLRFEDWQRRRPPAR